MNKVTKDEYVILKNVSNKFKWIVRSGYGGLSLYIDKPFKFHDDLWDDNLWDGHSRVDFHMFDHLFKFVKWDDKEPTNIEYVLKNCVIKE